MGLWFTAGGIAMKAGEICLNEECPCDGTVSCCGDFTMPAGKRYKVTVTFPGLVSGNIWALATACDCCESIDGPFLLEMNGCQGCCTRLVCQSPTATDGVFVNRYLVVRAWVDGTPEVDCTLHVRFTDWAQPSDDPLNCPVTDPIFQLGGYGPIFSTNYSYDLTANEVPGELLGPYTLDRGTDQLYITGTLFDTSTCARDAAMPATIEVEIVADAVSCGAIGACTIEEPADPVDCLPVCDDTDAEPPTSITVELAGFDCCEDLNDSHTFDLVAAEALPCCLLYVKSFLTVFCVGDEFSATHAFVLICYTPAPTDETYIVQGWYNTITGGISLTPGASLTLSGKVDCNIGGYTTSVDNPDACGGNTITVVVEW